jgi:hypothetical protein
MNFKTILIGLISSLCLLSCSKDELKDVTLPMSYYDINVDLSNSIKIDSIYSVKFKVCILLLLEILVQGKQP